MNFFDSIWCPFRLWQLLCFSPFTLDQIPTAIPRRIRKFYFAIAVVAMFHLLIIFAAFCTCEYLRLTRDLWILISAILHTNFGILTHAVALIESFARRNKQKQLLLQFDQIDSIVRHKIGIPIDYVTQRHQYVRRLKRRCIIYCLLATLSFGAIFTQRFIICLRSALSCCYYIIFVIWFHRYTTFVDVIYKRYRWINERINKIYLNDLNRMGTNENLTVVDGLVMCENRDEIEKNGQPIDKFQLIRDIKEASLLLVEASKNVNEIFAVSSTFFVFFEFVSLFLVNYFYFEWAIRHNSIFGAIISVIQLLPHCDTLLSLTAVCENATEEARKFKGYVQKLNIISVNTELSRLVSLSHSLFFDSEFLICADIFLLR